MKISPSIIVGALPIGLTDCQHGAILSALSPHVAVGRENPNGTGENSPQPFVAFLCPSYCAAICRALSLWRGHFGKPHGLPHLFAVFSPQPDPAAYAVRSMIGGYSLLRTGLPA